MLGKTIISPSHVAYLIIINIYPDNELYWYTNNY